MNKAHVLISLLIAVFLLVGCGKKENAAEDLIRNGNSKMAKGDLQGAITDYTRAIEADPRFKSAYFNRGQAKTTLHDLEGAISDYSKAIELDQNYGTYYFARGMAKFALKNYQEAILDFTIAIQSEPSKHPEAYMGRGLSIISNAEYMATYVGKQLSKDEVETIQKAVTDFNRAIKLKSDFVEAYSGRGIAENILQDYQVALLDFNKSIELDPTFAEAYAHRGITQIKLGKISQGCTDLKKAGELGYAEAFDLDFVKPFCK
jgi:tetratricopeptide (TPR) repeat protein